MVNKQEEGVLRWKIIIDIGGHKYARCVYADYKGLGSIRAQPLR